MAYEVHRLARPINRRGGHLDFAEHSMGVIDVANHCYRDGEYSVRPMVNQDEFPGWPGYVVEYTYWYFDRDGEKDMRTDVVKWHSTYKEADLHRHNLETEGK